MKASPLHPCLTGHRIIVGPNDIAGFGSRIAKALASSGAEVLFFNSNNHSFNPVFTESANLKRLFWREAMYASKLRSYADLRCLAGYILSFFIKLLGLVYAITWSTTIVMIGGKGFIAGGLEYAFIRLFGIQVIHMFVGTASRPRYLSGYAKAVIKNGDIDRKSIKRLVRRTTRQAARVNRISRHASVVIENPLCAHFQQSPFINFYKVGVPLDSKEILLKPRITDNTPARSLGKVRILHCPSNPEIKGSSRIREVIDKLIAEGLPLELRFITSIAHSQVLHEISQADIVIDQLYSDSPFTGIAAEAAAFGKAVVAGGYGWKLFGTILKDTEIPAITLLSPDELETGIRSLLMNRSELESLGQTAKMFLEEEWSETKIAQRFYFIVSNKIPKDWWINPEEVQYLHGMGLDENELRILLKSFIHIAGCKSLALNHNTALARSLIDFSNGSSCWYRRA